MSGPQVGSKAFLKGLERLARQWAEAGGSWWISAPANALKRSHQGFGTKPG